MSASSLTPREIVSELDRYIVGQAKAKRAVAVALRNRWRRQSAAPDLREEIMPKNIIMIGPTGVGKTEIARRLAKLAQAPFVKVEASKFTEVGYVGRDVESIVRDLVEVAIALVREEQRKRVEARAKEAAEDRLLQLLSRPEEAAVSPGARGPFLVSSQGTVQRPDAARDPAGLRALLRSGQLDDDTVELEVSDSPSPLVSIFGSGHGMEDMEIQLKDMLGQLPGMRGGKKHKRKLKVRDARKLLEDEEAQKLIDMDVVKREAVERTEQAGIVFLDEIDKIAGPKVSQGPDVSREGVQRDLLPIVEGSTVNTKHGPVKTDHVLFIAAGAFHVSSVSDLIPELQGRFPIRVELEALKKDDFVRILKEPKNALTRQYSALLAAEGVELSFTDSAIESIAEYAASANQRAENIGARRLHTVMEALLDELSFDAPELNQKRVVIDAADVHRTLSPILADEDLAKFIL
ncbi:MAG TPA: ATP-dependent protease ATPase subunit HslU [Polyangiales bacterium]|nr:ATP-dependent protease ATPase subunit HslU [Polyangiales bacterium]